MTDEEAKQLREDARQVWINRHNELALRAHWAVYSDLGPMLSRDFESPASDEEANNRLQKFLRLYLILKVSS